MQGAIPNLDAFASDLNLKICNIIHKKMHDIDNVTFS